MNRRQLMTGVISACAAPAIVRAQSLMPGRGVIIPTFMDLVSIWAKPSERGFEVAHLMTLDGGRCLFHVDTHVPRTATGHMDANVLMARTIDAKGYFEFLARTPEKAKSFALATKYENRHPDLWMDESTTRIH